MDAGDSSSVPLPRDLSSVPLPRDSRTDQKAGARTVVRRALVAASCAFLFCFAMIPLYSIYCEITGANGKTGRLDPTVASVVDRSRKVRVEFTSSVNSGLAWTFKPELNSMDVHPGEVVTAYFDAANLAPETIVGNAVPSVAPNEGSIYFNKTECFCFTEQALKAGESRRMPVRFVIDTAMPKEIEVLTLSYTFYRNQLATSRVALLAPKEEPIILSAAPNKS